MHLSGTLVCRDLSEVQVVREMLPRHIELTLLEPGCLDFLVEQTDDPLVWRVEERFAGSDAFRAHQARVASSDWGAATAGIERFYEVEGLD
ncbi:antibiotic biosynthesis monooxygenase [Nocardioides sp. GY 10113]|nr:antibiotic biosynthesis monooxygenase [Nocardioides sp. GY 10113]